MKTNHSVLWKSYEKHTGLKCTVSLRDSRCYVELPLGFKLFVLTEGTKKKESNKGHKIADAVTKCHIACAVQLYCLPVSADVLAKCLLAVNHLFSCTVLSHGSGKSLTFLCVFIQIMYILMYLCFCAVYI